MRPESADVHPYHGLPRQTHVQQHGHGKPVLPEVAAIIACPGRGVSLDSGKTGTGHEKRAFPRLKLLQPFVAGSRHEKAVAVMNRSVGHHSRPLPVTNRVGQGAQRGEERGLIHVVPEPVQSRLGVTGKEASPPRASLVREKVGESGWTRPYRSMVDLSISVPAEEVPFDTLLVDLPGRIPFQPGIGNGNDSELFCVQRLHQARRIGKGLVVPCKTAAPIHVSDVEVEHVAGNAMRSKGLGYAQDSLRRFRFFPSRVLVPQGPERRKGISSRQEGELFEHIFQSRPCQHVVAERTNLCRV